jgi:hypothetical protein
MVGKAEMVASTKNEKHALTTAAKLAPAGAPIDLSDLTDEQRVALLMCVREFHLAGRRATEAIFVMTNQLAMMQEILGEGRFYPYAMQTLNISDRTIRRHLHINNTLKHHFANESFIDYTQTRNFTKSAIELLSPETDESVVIELKELASAGKKIDASTVREVLKQRDQELEAQLASAQAELASKTKQLGALQQQVDNDHARAVRDEANHAERLRRAEETRILLEEELETLKKQETPVITEFKEKPVIPEGYKSVKDAIAAKEAELVQLRDREAEIRDRVGALEQQEQAALAKLNELKSGTEEFLRLKDGVDQLAAKFPLAMLRAMSARDKEVKAAIAGLGKMMVQLGNQLTTASA